MRRGTASIAWAGKAPVREELFGIERLEQHAQSLAAAQPVTRKPPTVPSLRKRLDENAKELLAAYRASAAEVEAGERVVPAAEWLLDNYHLVEKQIREVRSDLPANYYRQLPKLASGPFAGYPRVFGIAWAFVAHSDSHVEIDALRRFLVAYQTVQPLTIGELWAVAITLRIVLIENLRRLSDQIGAGRSERADADLLASRLLDSSLAGDALAVDIASRSPSAVSELFAAQLAKRLRGHDPLEIPAMGWLEDRLARQGTTVDEAVAHSQQRQGASNVTVRNVITSLRLMSDIEWADLFESVSLVDARLGAGSDFAAMDFPTRNLYRSAIEELARGSEWSELDIADQALAAARAAAEAQSDVRERARVADPGFHLIGEGRTALAKTIGFRARRRLWLPPGLPVRFGTRVAAYIGVVLAGAVGLLALAVASLPAEAGEAGARACWVLGLLLPAIEVSTGLVQRMVARLFPAMALPALELADGVPEEMRTLVAVPTLLTTEADLLEQIERLEVHHLAGGHGDIAFALLVDGTDADTEVVASDAPLIAVATEAMAALNLRHGPAAAGCRFLFLHRRRRFNEAEGTWMGWERKRGKLHELDRLLRGATDTSFVDDGTPLSQVPPGVRYVLTLDADTRLPRDATLRLVGKMAHPLNRPRFDPATQRIVAGHAILQPRITPSLPVGREGSLYQRISSSPGGMDPYAMAVSDVYQDLFGEGSFTGKGIYDVDAFEASMRGRVPDNRLLSHDLFEGVFARSGLATDVELVEEAPARYDVAARRQHRWMRGDWQLLPWILARGNAASDVGSLGRLKMLDNLRRSLLAPSMLFALSAAWMLPTPASWIAAACVVGALAVPALVPLIFAIRPTRPGVRLRSHFLALGTEIELAVLRMGLDVALLTDQAWRAVDAVLRTLVRLLVTRRHLLEWTTAAQAGRGPRLDLPGFYRRMAGGTALGVLLVAPALLGAWPAPAAWPFLGLWLAAPAWAWWASRQAEGKREQGPSADDADALRLIARRTWRFFETFVTPADNMLPPDNFQEDPKPVVAHRTSPTNIGLYLLAAVSARDFGWSGTLETVERLEATLLTLSRLRCHKGHFFNWYDTGDLRALDPPYVSSVDSGNLAGHLIAAANACEEWRDGAPSPHARMGMADALRLAREALGRAAPRGRQGQRVANLLDDIAAQLQQPQAVDALAPALARLVRKATASAHALDLGRGQAQEQKQGDATDPAIGDHDELVYWIEALGRAGMAHARDCPSIAQPQPLAIRLQALADAMRDMAMAMDFAFLLDPRRKLLSIGYSLNDQRLDLNCYDLLGSEARLASLFAIAKGDVPTRHWFRLGRAATPVGNGSALISWSGSMFEYLMPSLVMRAPSGSLLEQTNRLVVQRQIEHGKARGVPWGISESAYNARDLEYTYQYSNFGVPALGLKRGLADNLVVAPYATGLGAMVDPAAACRNFERLAELGALGRHGYYEALDFTPARVPEGQQMAIVRSYMAHHQGMTLVSIANVLQDGRMRARFHREPMIQSSELLLQERMPRDVSVAHRRTEDVRESRVDGAAQPAAVRRLSTATPGPAPVTHLLSNGSYTVMLTAAGAGYSRWRGLAITRWREDFTREDAGAFIYLRELRVGPDMGADPLWSVAARPLRSDTRGCEVQFAEDRATFTNRNGDLAASLEVIVSGENDGEVRRISLANRGRRVRELDITSYAELVLDTQAADVAHPAFSKLFLLTEYLPEFGALIATRRARSPDEPKVWAAHFAVVEGEVTAEPQYESDRARFLGRRHDASDPVSVTSGVPLSNTVGTVLDAVFSLRQRVRILPGGLARIAFWTVVAPSREEVLDLVDRHHDRSAFERAATLAWTQAQVQLRHIGVDAEEAADFQRMAAPLLYADAGFRASPEAIARGAGPQSGLWPHAVSGDLPIVLLRIDDLDDIAQVRQLLSAHEYWRMKQLGVDLVILNERASSYVQDLQVAIETAVRSSQARPRLDAKLAQGTVHVLRADLLGDADRALLQSAARIDLVARHGTIGSRMDRRGSNRQREALHASQPPRGSGSPEGNPPLPMPPMPALSSQGAATDDAFAEADRIEPLEFFNGLGGFASNGREYVVRLHAGQSTPAPWINVIANRGFGFQVSAEGSGATWADNSRENQLTPWPNDPVVDPSGEAIYVRDEASGELWSATQNPIAATGAYETRHGHGYSRFAHAQHGIALDLLQFVPMEDPVKLSRLRLRNGSNKTRRLSVTLYVEWVLGTSRSASAPFVVTGVDPATGALLARRPWGTAFPGRVAFADLGGRQTAWTADRTEFLGRHGSARAPAALLKSVTLSGATGAGLDPCAVLQCSLTLAPGESVDLRAMLGQGSSDDEASRLVERYRQADLDEVLAEVTRHWSETLGAVEVRTPDRAMDLMLNGWLLYQTIACRLWARAAYYQASGAYGFRDQLQDGMALLLTRPEETRHHLLRAASRQFVEGDVQHWWLPHSGQGVRTRISDDRVWLAYATASYVIGSGDTAVLDEPVAFLEGPPLRSGEHDAFFQPMPADEEASLFEHCARGLDQCIELTGELGMPLMGTGDWNDGMNRVGQEGKGESVWLGWLLLRTIDVFAPLAKGRDEARAARWRAHAESVRAAIEREAWDGAWYRRATFDDGSWLGSKDNDECRIDAIAQAWSVLSGRADPERAAIAMASLAEHLVRPSEGVALLLAPPFDRGAPDPGYIQGYPPGLRENGGQYSHAAMWAILAFVRLGDGASAASLFELVNPIHHARTPEEAARYKVEPYVVAADVYGVQPHAGRGGWTWYTGSAGWMYRAGIEGLLGIRREGDTLRVWPCIPPAWDGFEATVRIAGAVCEIEVRRAGQPAQSDRSSAQLDGAFVELEVAGVQGIAVPLDGMPHRLLLTLGAG
ncbi:Cyclic beta-(1,2)-glucan synthase NdvB [Burkholderiales bacterium 8X]|nr:Cyclic beta-(1,2)-glucan synthase NdvB [Burkholderiales bacterium 8X]